MEDASGLRPVHMDLSPDKKAITLTFANEEDCKDFGFAIVMIFKAMGEDHVRTIPNGPVN